MSDVKSTTYTKATAPTPATYMGTEYEGRVKSILGTYECASLAAGSTIKVGMLRKGETFVAGVRIILTSNIGNRSGRYCWGNIDFLDNVYSSVALFILNSAEYDIDSVTRMARRKQIHLVYWVFDTANLSNVMFDISPNETRLAEGNEFLRKAYYKLNNTTWDATPDFDVCQRCVLKCDKRINYIRR